MVNLIESAITAEFTSLVTFKHFGDESIIVEEVLTILEDAQVSYSAAVMKFSVVFAVFQMYNALQLARWCLNFLCCNYNRACKQHPKLVKNLSQGNQEVLARNRWPPIW